MILRGGIWAAWDYTHRPYTHAALEKRLLGASAAEVRWTLGGPDDIVRPMSGVVRGNEGYWVYRGRTVDDAGHPDHQVNVWFTNGRCDQIDYR